jgi:hypothetical protein
VVPVTAADLRRSTLALVTSGISLPRRTRASGGVFRIPAGSINVGRSVRGTRTAIRRTKVDIIVHAWQRAPLTPFLQSQTFLERTQIAIADQLATKCRRRPVISGGVILPLVSLDRMRLVIAIVLVAVSFVVSAADTFDARVQRARDIEATPAGEAYQDEMWPLVQPFMSNVMKRCVSDNPTSPLISFKWIATLTVEGKLVGVETQPNTELSRCFQKGMELAPFPKPSQEFAPHGLPLTFNMRLHPMQQ